MTARGFDMLRETSGLMIVYVTRAVNHKASRTHQRGGEAETTTNQDTPCDAWSVSDERQEPTLLLTSPEAKESGRRAVSLEKLLGGRYVDLVARIERAKEELQNRWNE